MPAHWIIFDWDLPRLKLLSAKLTGGQWTVHAAHQVQLPDSLAQSNRSNEIADWLNIEFPELRGPLTEPVKVAVILPRDRVTVRQLQLPDIPAAELPSIVPMQMSLQLTTRFEDLVVDFLPPLPASPENDGQQLLAAAITTPVLNQLQQFATAWNAELESVSVSCCSLHEYAVQLAGLASDQAAFVSCSSTHRTETLLVNGPQLIASRYRRRNSPTPVTVKELAAEVRLLSAQTETATANANAQTLMTIADAPASNEPGRSTEDLSAELANTLQLTLLSADTQTVSGRFAWNIAETERKDPLTPAEASTLLGGLLAISEPQTPQLNFQSPRQPVEVPDRRNVYIGGAVAAALLVLLASWWSWSSSLADLDDQIETLEMQIGDTQKFIDTKGDLLKQTAIIEQYQSRSLEMTPHWQSLLNVLPARDQLLLTTWRSFPSSGQNHTRVVVQGLAVTRQQVEQFAEQLDQLGLVVRSPVVRPTETENKFGYEFELDYEVPEQLKPAVQNNVAQAKR